MIKKHFPFILVPALIFILFVIIYSMTIYPGPGGRINYNDSIYKMLLPTSDRVIPHVTGFPLYILISKIFYYIIPCDSLFPKITAMSIFFGALTLAFVYLVSYTLSGNKTGSILAALVMGFSYTFWTQSTEAEIYTLNAFFIVIVAFLFIKFHQTVETGYLLWGNFFYALSFGNHLVVIFLLPALIYIVYKTDKKIFFNKKIILMTLLFIILGMIPYLILYLRFSRVGLTSVSHYFGFVTGGAWKGMAMFVFNIFDLLKNRIDLFLTHLNHQFFLHGILASLSGIYAAFFSKKEKTPFLFLLFILLFQLFFCINYGIHDIEVYFIPIYIILAMFISLLFSDKTFFKVKMVLIFSIIVCQLVFNLGRENILVRENKPLNTVLFLVKNIPPGSSILVPEYFNRNGDYTMLARYITYTGEYGNYKIVFHEEDTRIPYVNCRDKGCKEYYLNSSLDKILEKVKNKDSFYFIGNRNKRQLKRDGNFIIKVRSFGKDRWIGMAKEKGKRLLE
jgi:hypothetical protein